MAANSYQIPNGVLNICSSLSTLHYCRYWCYPWSNKVMERLSSLPEVTPYDGQSQVWKPST